MEWQEYTKGCTFITDLGEAAKRKEKYAVWVPSQEKEGQHQIAEVGEDLHKLQEKYCVKNEYVFRVQAEMR